MKTLYKFSGDMYWLKEEQVELSINRQNIRSVLELGIYDDTITIEPTDDTDSLNGVDSLEAYKSKIKAYDHIRLFNQLGIKNYLWREKKSHNHSRKYHSFGAAIIGISYFSALKPFINGRTYKNIAEDDKCIKLLNLALLLHDVGHLPFSHLMEEVFHDVNWTRAKGKYHRHDDAPLEQLSDKEKEGIKEAIKKALSISSGEDEYFEVLQDLIAGISGVPFLDAIVNSPVDADKIDYIFRDMEYTGATARLGEPKEWLADFLSDLSLSPEGLVRLNGKSSLRTLQLLQERLFLYKALYLQPEIRVFEKIAATVIISWLTRNVPRHIEIPEEIDSDLTKKKGDIAYELLIEEFYRVKDEFDLLINICEQLESDDKSHQDKNAKEWFGHIKKLFKESKFKKNKYKELACSMIVGEPFYLARVRAKEAREIARNLYVDYPCGVLIDIVESPRFLPSARSRRFKTQNKKIEGEQFLVPDADFDKWSRNKIARIPLHLCDFTALEQEFTQVVVVNTLKDKKGEGEYIYDLFISRCRAKGIEPIPSPWRSE